MARFKNNSWYSILMGILFCVGIFVAVDVYYSTRPPIPDPLNTVGYVAKKIVNHKRGNTIVVRFTVRGKGYTTYFNPADDEYDRIDFGYPFRITYSRSDPDRSDVMINAMDSAMVKNSVRTAGTIFQVKTRNYTSFLRGKSTNYSIFYNYYYEGLEYECVVFTKEKTGITEGGRYSVYVSKQNPRIGLLDLNKPLY